MNPSQQVHIRRCDPRRDAQELLALDFTYLSPGYLAAFNEGDGLRLRRHSWPEPRRLSFPFKLDDIQQQQPAWVAVRGERVVGFVSVELSIWNRRLIIWHFYVDNPARQQGVGRRLMQVALEYGVAIGAKVAWAETSNCNLPGIGAYIQLGFRLCGCDASLYCDTLAEGQVAIFMARVLAPDTHLALDAVL